MYINYEQEVSLAENRKKLWSIELEMMNVLDTLCTKYGIKYFLIGGALIGAIRHKGFIPWDDDIDIGMMRVDYEKFITVAEKELKAPMSLQTYKTEKGYYSDLIRIRHAKSTGILGKDVNKRCNNGTFIEIYAYDNVPDNINIEILLGKNIKFWDAVLNDYYNNPPRNSMERKVVAGFTKVYSKIFPFEFTYKIWDGLRKSYMNHNTKFASCEFSTKKGQKNINKWRVSDISETIKVPFENLMLSVPKNYDNCLRICYGDYMQIPPLEQREAHHMRDVYYDPFHPYTDYFKEEQSKYLNKITTE